MDEMNEFLHELDDALEYEDDFDNLDNLMNELEELEMEEDEKEAKMKYEPLPSVPTTIVHSELESEEVPTEKVAICE